MQRWLSGLRRTTGNRVYLVRVPRVQIPLSAPSNYYPNSEAEFGFFYVYTSKFIIEVYHKNKVAPHARYSQRNR